MKTTVDIPDALLRAAKTAAAERGVTLKVVLEEALRAALETGGRPQRPRPFRMRVFEGNGLQPGLTRGDWRGWREITYEGRGE